MNMITKFILEELLNFNGPASELMEELINQKRYVYAKMHNPNLKKKDYRKYKSLEGFLFGKEKQKINNLIYKLQRGGFVERIVKNDSSFWKITESGKRKLEKISKYITLPKNQYKTEKDDKITIIIFDIPEKLSRLRRWLRFNLLALDFQKLQKSVWIGQVKLPSNFLKDIQYLNLDQYIYIFEVIKRGAI